MIISRCTEITSHNKNTSLDKDFKQTGATSNMPQCNQNNVRKTDMTYCTNQEKWKQFLMKLRTRQACPYSPFLFNRVLEALLVTLEKKKKSMTYTGKEGNHLSILRGSDSMHGRTTILPKRLLELITKFGKVARYKINIQKSTAFVYANNGNMRKKPVRLDALQYTLDIKNT